MTREVDNFGWVELLMRIHRAFLVCEDKERIDRRSVRAIKHAFQTLNSNLESRRVLGFALAKPQFCKNYFNGGFSVPTLGSSRAAMWRMCYG